MTTQALDALTTPRLEARTFAVQVTARGAHPTTLATLANDAASGHPSQRITFPRTVSDGVFSGYWIPTTVPRYLRVEALVTSQTPTISASTKLALSLADSLGGAVPSSDASIPVGLKGTEDHISSYSTAAPSRLGDAFRLEWYLDVEELIAAGLDLAAAWWRFDLDVDVTTPSELELFHVEELPRYLIDDAEDFGQVLRPAPYAPRGNVVDGSPGGLQRLWPTIRTGLMLGLRTYHSTMKPDADPWLITSTSFATFGGSDEESSGVPAKYRVRPRTMRPGVDTRVRYLIRYQITGATGGDTATVRLTTGAGTYDVVLTDVTGSLTECAWTVAYLDEGAEDSLFWLAKVSNGASTLKVVARPVIDHPEA